MWVLFAAEYDSPPGFVDLDECPCGGDQSREDALLVVQGLHADQRLVDDEYEVRLAVSSNRKESE